MRPADQRFFLGIGHTSACLVALIPERPRRDQYSNAELGPSLARRWGMNSPDSQKTLPERLPGRSFSDPRKPLGDGIIERADPLGGDPNEGVYGRVNESADIGHGVAERAKAVSVLRKAEELMASGNPDGGTDAGFRHAIELACGRCGVLIPEFDKIIDRDEELRDLMANVREAARQHAVKL